jgi:hypothetical protein
VKVRALATVCAMAMLAGSPAGAVPLQQDCRGQGIIGTAVMSPDGTITLNLRSPDGAEGLLVYKKGDPQYARIYSHLGGIKPGEHKPVPAFC